MGNSARILEKAMTNHITISACYTCVAAGSVDLSPKTWDDVKDWYIKWDRLYVEFEGADSYAEFELNSDALDGVDWKRPRSVDIYEGQFDYDVELAST
jgi:hypothetical protein